MTCTSCGLARLDPLPTSGEAEGVYGRGYFEGQVPGGYDDYVGDESLHRRNAQARLALIRRFWPSRPGALLDVGCALGFFLDEARADGWSASGVDVSPYAADWARRELNLDIRPEATSWIESGCRFDVVTFFQVLEHVARPDEMLDVVRESQRPGGLLVLETWNRASWIPRLSGRRWQQVNAPTVIHLFDRCTLRLLLARHGYEVQWTGRTTKLVRLEFALRLLERSVGRLVGSALRALERTPLSRAALRYSLGDLISVVAQRI